MTQDSLKEVFTFTWRIENFSMYPQKRGKCLLSPTFLVDAVDKTKWQLNLFPKGLKSYGADSVWCMLCWRNRKEDPKEITINFSLSLMKADRKLLNLCSKSNHVFKKAACLEVQKLVSLNTLFENKKTHLPDDVLTLQCCIWPTYDGKESPADTKQTTNVLGRFSLEEISSVVSDDIMPTEHCRSHCSFYTRIPVERRQITWTINNFKAQMKSKLVIPVTVESNQRDKSELILSCYVSGDRNSDDSVRIDIQRKDRDLKQMLVRCKVSVLDGNSTAQESQEGEHLFGEDYETWSFPPIIKLSTLENSKPVLLVDDRLSLRFEFFISFKGEEDIFTASERKTRNSTSTNDLRNDIINLLNNLEFTDVTLISEEIEFPAHKAVICARSPVFRAMFSGDTQENRTGVVRITDIDAETVDYMRHFMYHDRFPELRPEDAMRLYSAADKYDILKLKKQCSTFLKYSLSSSNVCDILELADLHQDSDLMRSVMNFLRIHGKEAFQSNQWKELMKDNLQLVEGIMHKMQTLTLD